MSHEIRAEVAGSVWQVNVAPGDQVSVGTELVVLESMKLEIPVVSPIDGVVEELLVAVEGAVEEGQVLAVVTGS